MKRPPLILASTSPYRRQLLERLNVPFSVINPEVDESPLPHESPQALVERLSREKAAVVGQKNRGAVVIGSDQVAIIDAEVLGKPGNHERAAAQLRQASGKEVVFLTGLCCYMTTQSTEYVQSSVVPFRVQFRVLSEEKIDRYLKQDKPYHCAGSFKSEGLGIALFERMIGDDPTALMGLPLIRLSQMLEEAGILIL
ncbi:MAG: septum formation inhibitor Maf [Magnetococcales bacterium]|nr:septum formation inhibitor Maf [Magnetococcales bacterium]